MKGQIILLLAILGLVGLASAASRQLVDNGVNGFCTTAGSAWLDPCQYDQWEFEFGTDSTDGDEISRWIHFRFKFDFEPRHNYQFDKEVDYTSYVSVHYSETQGFPEVGLGNIVSQQAVVPFTAYDGRLVPDGEYEWTYHCDYRPGFYYITVESGKTVNEYLSRNETYQIERFPYQVQMCSDETTIVDLPAFTPFCQNADGENTCWRSESPIVDIASYRDFYHIDALERLSAHLRFHTPTAVELGDRSFYPGMRVRIQNREDRETTDDLGQWVVTVRKAAFTSAAFFYQANNNGTEVGTCSYDYLSTPVQRQDKNRVHYFNDPIDVWIPRCDLELDTDYYISVVPPHSESVFDFLYSFQVSLQIDQTNPYSTEGTVGVSSPLRLVDSIEGFLLPLGQVKDLNLGSFQGANAPDRVSVEPGQVYPLSFPFAPSSLWDDLSGPVDRYERPVKWYQVTVSGWQTAEFPTLTVNLQGVQWGRRTDDGQWNQLGFNSFAPRDGRQVFFSDHARTLSDADMQVLSADTWLNPHDLSEAMQRFSGLGVDSVRDVTLMIASSSLPVGSLEYESGLLRFNPKTVLANSNNRSPWVGIEWDQTNSTRRPDASANACPTADFSCTVYPDRLHEKNDGSTSACTITLSYCQLNQFLVNDQFYIGVAPVSLVWAEQERSGYVTKGPAAPFQGLDHLGPDGSSPFHQRNKRKEQGSVSRLVHGAQSGNPASPTSGNYELQWTLQDMDLRFALEVELTEHVVSSFASFPSDSQEVQTVGEATAGAVEFFSIDVVAPSMDAALEVELYTPYAGMSVYVSLYYFEDALDAVPSCDMGEAMFSCRTNFAGRGSCVFNIDSGMLAEGTYLLSVSGSEGANDSYDLRTISYNLRASYSTASSLAWEQPTNAQVWTGSYVHYSADVPEDNQTVALRVRVSDVVNGKVTAFVRYGAYAGDNDVYLYDFKCTPWGGYSVCDLVYPYCINQAGTYYISVRGDETTWDHERGLPANGKIAFVITPYLHRAEWVDWMPSPDVNAQGSEVYIARTIPTTVTGSGIVKFADDIVRPDVRYFFWNDGENSHDELNPALPGTQQPAIPVAGFRPLGELSFGRFATTGWQSVLGAEAHYYWFEYSPSNSFFNPPAPASGTSSLVSTLKLNQHDQLTASGPETLDTLSLFISPYTIANDMCNCWSCQAGYGAEHYSHCKIVLQECELLNGRVASASTDSELWYVTVRYDQYDLKASLPTDYTLSIAMRGDLDTPLVDGTAVYSSVAAHEYKHFFIDSFSGSLDTALNVEMYINRDYIDAVQFYMNRGSRAGPSCDWGVMTPLCEGAPVAEGQTAPAYTTCSFKIHPCDFDPTETLWFSVYAQPGEGLSYFAEGEAEFTLRVWTEPVVDLTPDNWPITGLVTDINYYRLTVDSSFFGTEQIKHLFLQLDGVRDGEVRTWLTKDFIGVSCSDSSCPGDRRPFEGEFELEIDNCQLAVGDVYYLSVAAVSFADPLLPVRYALRAYSKSVSIVPLTQAQWGRDTTTPLQLSLDRLESVSLRISPDVTGDLLADPLVRQAQRVAASLHVRIYNVSWGTMQYWTSSNPTGTASGSSLGSYPYGVASPECHTQRGGVTGNTYINAPAEQHWQTTEFERRHPGPGLDPRLTFGELPPDEIYLRFACDLRFVEDVFITLTATVVPEWERLACDRRINATVRVWIEYPTILDQPNSLFALSRDGHTSQRALEWAQAPEPLTIWGPNRRENFSPKRPQSQNNIWSATFQDEYKLFVYPIDFSAVDSVGLIISADENLPVSGRYYPTDPSVFPNEWVGLDVPYKIEDLQGTLQVNNISRLWGDKFEAYFLFVSADDLNNVDANAAVPGELEGYCGFSMPGQQRTTVQRSGGFSADSRNHFSSGPQQPIHVFTACQMENQPGVLFVAVRYPSSRPELPAINPGLAVVWQFPNSVTPDAPVVHQFDLSQDDNLTTASILAHGDIYRQTNATYDLGVYERMQVRISFPPEWDTLFPYWAYQVSVDVLEQGSESSSVPFMWAWGEAPVLYPVIEQMDVSGVSWYTKYRDNIKVGRFKSRREDFTLIGCSPAEYGGTAIIGGGTTCCRREELHDSRDLWISFANNRAFGYTEYGSFVPDWEDGVLNATVRISLTVFPFYSNDYPLFSTVQLTPLQLTKGNVIFDTLYYLRVYEMDLSPGPNQLVNFDMWVEYRTPGLANPTHNNMEVFWAYEKVAFEPGRYGEYIFSDVGDNGCYEGSIWSCTVVPSAQFNHSGNCYFQVPSCSWTSGTWFMTVRFQRSNAEPNQQNQFGYSYNDPHPYQFSVWIEDPEPLPIQLPGMESKLERVFLPWVHAASLPTLLHYQIPFNNFVVDQVTNEIRSLYSRFTGDYTQAYLVITLFDFVQHPDHGEPMSVCGDDTRKIKLYASTTGLAGVGNETYTFSPNLDFGQPHDNPLYFQQNCYSRENLCEPEFEEANYPNRTQRLSEPNSYCRRTCRIPLCALDNLNQGDSLFLAIENRVSLGTVEHFERANYTLNMTVEIEDPAAYLITAPTPLVDGVPHWKNQNYTNDFAFYYDYVPPATPGVGFDASYLEFSLDAVHGFLEDGFRAVLTVWPEYLCEDVTASSPTMRQCSAVPQPNVNPGTLSHSSCLITFDPCAFDRNTPIRFYASVMVNNGDLFDVFRPAPEDPVRAVNFTVMATHKLPTVFQTDIPFTGGEVFNGDLVSSNEHHHYHLVLDQAPESYSELTVCIAVSCERSSGLSPFRWQVGEDRVEERELEGTWNPPYAPYAAMQHNTNSLVNTDIGSIASERYIAREFIADSDSQASLYCSQPDSSVYLFQGYFDPTWQPEQHYENLVFSGVQSGDNMVSLIAGTRYVVVCSSPRNFVNGTLEVAYTYDPAVDFNVNSRYYNWANHWATNECNEWHADLSSEGYKFRDGAVQSACFSLTSCELQSGDLYLGVSSRNLPSPFYVQNYTGAEVIPVRYSITVSAAPKMNVPTPSIGLEAWYPFEAAAIFPFQDAGCAGTLSGELLLRLTGMEWGSQLRVQVRTDEPSTGVRRVCSQWGLSNLPYLDKPHLVSEHLSDVQGGCPTEPSYCVDLSDSAWDGEYYIYSTLLLDSCDAANGDLYMTFSGMSSSDEVRVIADAKYIPVVSLDVQSSSWTTSVQVVPNQWQYYKVIVAPLALDEYNYEFSVTVEDLVGGDAMLVTLGNGDLSVPHVPSQGCFEWSTSCQVGSSEPCVLKRDWCSAVEDEPVYWLGISGSATVNALMRARITVSLFVDLEDAPTLSASCETTCMTVPKGQVVYGVFSPEVALNEAIAFFDVRDLEGSIEIAVSQGHLPTPQCHTASWQVSSSDLVWAGDEQKTTVSVRYFNLFSELGPNDGLQTDESEDEWSNYTQSESRSKFLANPDARSFASERDLSEYSPFRYVLPCMDDDDVYFAFYAHQTSTFSWSIRYESIMTDVNTLQSSGDIVRWRSSPLDGFDQNSFFPFAATMLNDLAACTQALTASGQWPHLYKWSYPGFFPYGWELTFYKGAEKNFNSGLLIVNEGRVASPVLAAGTHQWPATPGLNPIAAALRRNNDGCSLHRSSGDMPATHWRFEENCDLEAHDFYFYIVFDYQKNRDKYNVPGETWTGRSVNVDGFTSTTDITFVSSAVPELTAPTTTTTTPATTTSTVTTTPFVPPSTTTTTVGPPPSTSTRPPFPTPRTTEPYIIQPQTEVASVNGYVPYEYVFRIWTNDAPTGITVDGPALSNIRYCDETNVFVLLPSSTPQPQQVVLRVSQTSDPVSITWWSEEDLEGCYEGEPVVRTYNRVEDCAFVRFTPEPAVRYYFRVSMDSNATSCSCGHYTLQAFYAGYAESWLAPVALPVGVQSLLFLGTDVRGAVYTVPAPASFLHVRLFGVRGSNVVAHTLWNDIFTVVDSCDAGFNSRPFFQESPEDLWRTQSATAAPERVYSHGLHGQCQMYLSPSDLLEYSASSNWYIGIVRDTRQDFGQSAFTHAEYQLAVTDAFTTLTAGSRKRAGPFTLSGEDAAFFTMSVSGSLVLSVVHESGPAVMVTIQDSMFDNPTWSMEPFWCLARTCTVELSALSQLSAFSSDYYVIVERQNRWQQDSTFSIEVDDANTLADYLTAIAPLPFCGELASFEFPTDIIDTTPAYLWSRSDLEDLDMEAYAKYTGLIDYFWGSPSAECQFALKAFTCLDAIRETSADGLVLPLCVQTCFDVVDACGEWTYSASLPEFDCGSSRYAPLDAAPGSCTGSVSRHTTTTTTPLPFYINATNTSEYIYNLTTTTGTTTTTTSTTSSTTTTGGAFDFFPPPATTPAPSIKRVEFSAASSFSPSGLVAFFVVLSSFLFFFF